MRRADRTGANASLLRHVNQTPLKLTVGARLRRQFESADPRHYGEQSLALFLPRHRATQPTIGLHELIRLHDVRVRSVQNV